MLVRMVSSALCPATCVHRSLCENDLFGFDLGGWSAAPRPGLCLCLRRDVDGEHAVLPAGETPWPRKTVTLFFFIRKSRPLVSGDDVVLALEQLVSSASAADAVDAQGLACLRCPYLGGEQHRLGGNTRLHAGRCRRAVGLLNEGPLDAQLPGANRAGIPGRPATDHDYINTVSAKGNIRSGPDCLPFSILRLWRRCLCL